jgi:hypothetical protein
VRCRARLSRRWFTPTHSDGVFVCAGLRDRRGPREALWNCGSARRVGKVGDGGKWVCDLHELRRAPVGAAAAAAAAGVSSTAPSHGGGVVAAPRRQQRPCIVYSFGSAGEFQF